MLNIQNLHQLCALRQCLYLLYIPLILVKSFHTVDFRCIFHPNVFRLYRLN